jgi:hypothetical protein
MAASLPGPSPPQTRPGTPGPGLAVSIGLMILGAVIGIASIVAFTVPLVRTFSSSAHSVPSHFPIHLRHARYTVFERTSETSGFSFGTRPTGRVTIEPSQVTVTAPDGEPVFVYQARNGDTMSRGSNEYTSAVQFDAPMGGTYDVRVSSRAPTAVIVTRSLRDVIRSVLVWFGTGAVGGIILIAGLVMLIVGITRRSRARRATQAGWGQPAWGQPAWGAQYPPPPYGPPPQYPPAPYGPPPQDPPDPWAPPGSPKS